MVAATEEITVRVSPEVARLYRQADPQQRRKLDLLIQFRLLDFLGGLPSMEEVLRQAGEQSDRAGLTQEKLKELLDE